eukprot:1139417-Pelagomonas_calceolata.AAC.6
MLTSLPLPLTQPLPPSSTTLPLHVPTFPPTLPMQHTAGPCLPTTTANAHPSYPPTSSTSPRLLHPALSAPPAAAPHPSAYIPLPSNQTDNPHLPTQPTSTSVPTHLHQPHAIALPAHKSYQTPSKHRQASCDWMGSASVTCSPSPEPQSFPLK